MARIVEVSIKRFKSIQDLQNQQFGSLTTIIGPNGSGKSNLIGALTIFFESLSAELQQTIGAVEDSLWFDHDTEQPIEISLVFALDVKEINSINSQFEAENQDIQIPILTDIDGHIRVKVARQIIATPTDMQWWLTEFEYGQLTLVGNNEYQDIGKLQGLEPDTATDPLRSFLRMVMEHLRNQYKLIPAARDNVQAPSRLGVRAPVINPSTLATIVEIAQSGATPNRKKWFTVRREFEDLHGSGIRLESAPGELYLNEEDLSTTVANIGGGDQALLDLFHEIREGPSIVAIEEPENHLNPRLIKKLLQGHFLPLLSQTTKQVIVVTHSPFMVDQSKIDSLLITSKTHKSTNFASPKNLKDLRDLLLVMGSKPSDFLFADAALVVEGESDRIFVAALSDRLGVSLNDMHVAIVPARGASKGRYHLTLWIEATHNVGIPIYMLLDSNAKAEADRVINEGLIQADKCHVLSKGDLEDYYPEDVLRSALAVLYPRKKIPADHDLTPGRRVKKLDKLLVSTVKKSREWKVPLAVEVSQQIDPAIIDDELASFLRKIQSEVGAFLDSTG